MSVKGYNRLARHYEKLERLVFGGALLRARLALLSDLPELSSILVLGEGDGRFLEALVESQPSARITVIEQSPKMIALAKQRLGQSDSIQFLCADVFSVELSGSFDMVVSCFFLDLFLESEVAELLARFEPCLRSGGFWYYADFVLPEKSWARLYGLVLSKLMILFFAWQTSMKVKDLVDPHSIFLQTGFKLVLVKHALFTFLKTRLYQKA